MAQGKDEITSQVLAKLSDERKLSPLFEREWEKRTGINPVALAIKDKNFKKGYLGLVCTSLALALAGGTALVCNEYLHFTSFQGMHGLGVIPLLVAFAGAVGLRVGPLAGTEEQELDRFCETLNHFYQWRIGGYQKSDSGFLTIREFLKSGDKELWEMADEILVAKALGNVIKEKQISEVGRGEGLAPAVEGMKLRAELFESEQGFSERHKMLRSVGLAIDSWKPYFKAARKIAAKKTAVASL